MDDTAAGGSRLVFRLSSSADDHGRVKIVAVQARVWYSSCSWRHVDDSDNGECCSGGGAVPGSRVRM